MLYENWFGPELILHFYCGDHFFWVLHPRSCWANLLAQSIPLEKSFPSEQHMYFCVAIALMKDTDV